MNDIEQLVRDALHDEPSVTTRVTDPVAVVTRRVRRVRLMLGGGAVAVGLVVAAVVVVPMQFAGTNGHGTHNLQITNSSSPTPSPASSVPVGQTVWQQTGSIAITSGDGWLWELCTRQAGKGNEVAKINPATHKIEKTWNVASSTDTIEYENGTVWLWSRSQHGDTVMLGGQVQAIDTTTSAPAARYSVNALAMNDMVLLPEPGGSDALLLEENAVVQLRSDLTGIHQVARLGLTGNMNDTIAATGSGAIWVRDGNQLAELQIDNVADGEALMASRPKDTVQFAGSVFESAGPDSLWASDGRLIQLTPSLLHAGVSAAEGDRIDVPGYVAAVAPDSSGGIFVSLVAGQVPAHEGQPDRPGVYHLSRAWLDSGNDRITSATPYVAQNSPVQDGPLQLAPDGQGGVDFTNDNNQAVHWQPAS